MSALTFIHDLNQWVNKTIEVNWILDTSAIIALKPLHRSWNEYNNPTNLPTPTWAPPPPSLNNSAKPVPNPPPPRQNVNNWNWDDCVVGEAPSAKKVCVGGNFAPTIQVMKNKGHPVPRNAVREDHCSLWYLGEKCKADCVQKTDHVPSFAVLEPLFQWCEQEYG